MTVELDYLKNKVYYSQNREDLILEAFFPDQNEGFYVDIGAYDPDEDSVTKLFYKKGWRGISVEPQKERYSKFVKRRVRDININCGVSDKNGELTLRSYKNGGLSTFSSKLKDGYLKIDNPKVSDFIDFTVPVMTLSDIFSKNNVEKINFLKIDVEGLEYEVLKGNDWKKYRPEVLCIESNNILKDWKSILTGNGYSFVFFDGLNDYYADDNTNKSKVFNYVDFIIEKKEGGIKYNDYMLYSAKEKHYDFLKSHELSQDKIIQECRNEISLLNNEIMVYKNKTTSSRALIKMLIGRVLIKLNIKRR